MRKTTEMFIKELEELKGEKQYQVIGEYKGNKEKIEVIHLKCGYHWNVLPINILNKNRECPKCNNCVKDKDTKYFKNEVFEKVNNEYTVLGEYKGALKKIEMRHEKCKKTYKVTPHDFLSGGNRCPYCNGNKKLTTDEFKNKVKKLEGEEYTILGQYINTDTKIKIKHNICNHVFEMTPYKFLRRNQRCPICRKSKGEQAIKKFLEKYNISFKMEYQFDDLIGTGGKPLRFDFAIFKNNKIIHLIEFDGEFHFEKMYINDGHETIKKHDIEKDNYCKMKKIPLTRIPYTSYYKIEELLCMLIPR